MSDTLDVLIKHDPVLNELISKMTNPSPPDLSTRGGGKKPPKTAQPYGILQPTKGVKPVQPPKPKLQPKKQSRTTAASMAKRWTKGKLVAAGVVTAAGIEGGRRLRRRASDYARGAQLVDNTTDPTRPVRKDFNIAKLDEDKRQVFGWASVITKDGAPVEDRQGDVIEPDEMEKSAYQYVLRSRKGGHQHRRDGEEVVHVSDMIESMAFTPEKIEKMGLPPETPVGWWVGFKVNDEDTWQKVKKGDVTGFSIHGRGKRIPLG